LALLLAACGRRGTERSETATPDAGTATAQEVEVRTVEYPKVETWDELQDHIRARHTALAEFAEERPVAIVYAVVTFAEGLPRLEVEALLKEYGIQLGWGEFGVSGSSVGGQGGLYDGQLATMEADPLFEDGEFVVYAIGGRTAAARWPDLMSDDRIAFIDAEIAVGRLTGAIPTDIVFQHPASIYALYQRLRPQ
jgi:hypothetical protein